MKKIYFAIFAIILAVVSCQKTTGIDTTSSNEGLTIIATIVGEETKAHFDGAEESESYPIYWGVRDSIIVFNTTGQGFVYQVEGISPSYPSTMKKKTAEFSVKGDPFTGDFACAFYPASQTINGTTYVPTYNPVSGKITAPISGTQIYNSLYPNSVARGSFPMVASGTFDAGKKNLNLEFHNLFSVLELNLTGSGQTVTDITVESSEYCFGEATIDPETKAVTFENENCQGKNMIETGLNTALSGTPSSFYIAIPAGSQSFTVAVATTESAEHPLYVKSVSARTFKKGVIKNMSSLELSNVKFKKIQYNGAPKSPYFVNGKIFAPVNAGYSTYSGGLIYQWGRKDGGYFTTSPVTLYGQTDIVTESTDISVANSNPTMFYTTLTGQTINTWNAGTEDEPAKAVNDPCPEGWRVPTKKEWLSLFNGSDNWSDFSASVKTGFNWSNFRLFGNKAYYSGSYLQLSYNDGLSISALSGGSQIGEYNLYARTNDTRYKTSYYDGEGGTWFFMTSQSGGKIGEIGYMVSANRVRCVSVYNDL